MVSKLDWQTFRTEFMFHCVPLPLTVVPHLSIKLNYYINMYIYEEIIARPMIKKYE